MQLSKSFIAELEESLNRGTSVQRANILRRVTDLFVQQAASYSADHIGLFDDVMGHLIRKIERVAMIELSDRLASIPNAPNNVIRQLSRDNDIEIAGPILEQSPVPSDDDLIEIARTKSQAHLAAIAGRKHINEPVTDVLVDRGDADVTHKVTSNSGARFSHHGFARMIRKAEHDANLAAAVAARRDVPPQLFDELVLRAAETVRQRLLAEAGPEMRERITQTLSSIARRVARSDAPRGGGRGGSVFAHDHRRLRANLVEFARAGLAPEVTATFAALCEIPTATVRHLVDQGIDEAIIILGKASGLGWPEIKDVLLATMPRKVGEPEGEKELFEEFVTLSTVNAQRVMRFLRTNKAATRDDIRSRL